MGSIDWNQFSGAGANPAPPPGPGPASRQKQKGGIDWAQFSGPAGAQAPQPAQQPTAAPPATGGLSDMWDAAKHHAGNFIYGGGQLLANGAAALTHKMEPGSDLDRDTAAMAARANADMQNREKQYQARVPDNAWSYTGAAAGELAPFVLNGPGRALDAAGDLAASAARRIGVTGKLATNVARGSAQTATMAAVSPTTSVDPNSPGGDYWSRKAAQIEHGAAVGAVVPAGVATLKGVYRGARAVAAPFTNPQSVIAPTLERMAPGSNIDALVQQLRNPDTFVPGSTPTTAQILQTPQAVMTEKAVSNTPAGKIALDARRTSNNDARLNYIDQFAGTDNDLAQALLQRRQNAQPMTSTLQTAAPIDASPIVQHLDSIASSGLGTDPVIRSAIGDARNVITGQASPGQNGGLFVSPDILDGVRQNMGGYLRKYASNGAVSSRQETALGPLKDTITDTIDGGVPGYRDYLSAYRADSVPINTMEQLQGIRSNVDTGALNASGSATFSLNNARQAVKGIDRAQYPIAPDADAAMDNVLSDLQRESISNSVRAAGSDTNLNGQAAPWLTRQLYGDGITGKPNIAAGIGAATGSGLGTAAGYALGPVAGGVTGTALAGALGWGASKIANSGAQRVNGALVDALLNPDVAADILQKQATARASNQALADWLSKTPLVGPYMNALPAPPSN